MMSVDLIGKWYPIEIVYGNDMGLQFFRKVSRCHSLSNYAGYAVELEEEMFKRETVGPDAVFTRVQVCDPLPSKFVPNPTLTLISYANAVAAIKQNQDWEINK